MKRTLIGVIVAAFVLTGTVTASAAVRQQSSNAKPTGLLKWAGPSLVGQQMDPAKVQTASETPAVMSIYDRLFQIDKNLNVKPEVGTSYKFSADGKTLTVPIRSDVTFHDGTKLDAAAVKGTIDRIKSAGGPNAKSIVSAIDSVDVVNPTTLQFNLNRPGADVPAQLARDATSIINPKAISGNVDLSKGDNNMAGSGPWIVGSGGFTPLTSVDLVRTGKPYWDKKAGKIKEIQLQAITDPNTLINALSSGQINAASSIPGSQWDAAAAVTANKLYKINTASSVYEMIRASRPPLDNLKVRQAIIMATDRNAIANGLLTGSCAVTNQGTPPGQVSHSDNLKDTTKFNVKKAKQLLSDAGYPNGLTISLVLPQAQEPPFSVGNAIQAQLAKAGITANVTQETPAQSLIDFNAGKFDAYIQMATGQPSPAIWFQRMIEPAGLFHMAPPGPEGDAFTAAVNATLDPNAKSPQAKWDTVNQMINDQAWGSPLCFQISGYSTPKNLQGVSNMSWTWGNLFDFRYLSMGKS